MSLLKSTLLASAAGFAAVAGAQAADLPVKKAAPIEYVRVCTAYGAGFFYIPGTDTCIRLSGRARFEGGYQTGYSRQSGSTGDSAGYSTRLRINVDARTQTGYGTLRAFLRLETGSRTGGSYGGGTSGTQQRIGNAYAALGVDQFGRAQQYVNTDKAFVQFAGFTAGRASSFFDFYAHDFEFAGATAGSDLASTNLLAYTATLGNGFSATLSVEDPTFRRTPIFSPSVNAAGVTVNAAVSNFGLTVSPVPVFIGTNAAGVPTRFSFVDAIERNRLPDFVGALRYDAAWGSAQISAAVHEINVGNVANGAGTGTGTNVSIPHTNSDYGYAVQGGLKINAPFIAPRRRAVSPGRLRRRRAALHRLLLVLGLLRAEPGDDPGPEVLAVLLRRDDQPVYRSAEPVRELHRRRRLPALLGSRVAFGRVRLLRRAVVLGRRPRRPGAMPSPLPASAVRTRSARPVPGSTTSARRSATPTSSSAAQA